MNRFFPIYHGLHPEAPWGVALERAQGTPRSELAVLCRTEAEAAHYAKELSLIQGKRCMTAPAGVRAVEGKAV